MREHPIQKGGVCKYAVPGKNGGTLGELYYRTVKIERKTKGKWEEIETLDLSLHPEEEGYQYRIQLEGPVSIGDEVNSETMTLAALYESSVRITDPNELEEAHGMIDAWIKEVEQCKL